MNRKVLKERTIHILSLLINSKLIHDTLIVRPAVVPLLAMKLAMSMGLLSMVRFLMQPTKSRFLTGKSSGRLGTPPSNKGPVRSNDLQESTSVKELDIVILY